MANTNVGKILTIDSVGVVTANPVWIRKIILYPNAAGDAAVLGYWNPSSLIAAGTGSTYDSAVTGTITSTTTLTMSAGTYLPSSIAIGSVFKITASSGASANVNLPVLVTTAGNNTVIVGTNAGWTNEATKKYAFETYNGYTAFSLLCPATEKQVYQVDFARPFNLPNLTLWSVSTSAKVYVYLA